MNTFLFNRAMELKAKLEFRLGDKEDWLSKYRSWLDDNEIVSEEDGYPSKEAYDEMNIYKFMKSKQTK